jgi:hypothetical protein
VAIPHCARLLAVNEELLGPGSPETDRPAAESATGSASAGAARMFLTLVLWAALLGACSGRAPGDDRPDSNTQPDLVDDSARDLAAVEPEAVPRGGFAIGGRAVESESYRGRVLLTVPVQQVTGGSPSYRVTPESVSAEGE